MLIEYKKEIFNKLEDILPGTYDEIEVSTDAGHCILSLSEIDELQGRGKDSVHSSYFMENPQILKKKYIVVFGVILLFVKDALKKIFTIPK